VRAAAATGETGSTQLSLALDAGLVLINAKAASPLGLCKKRK
jgi:hypothetical protein